MLFTFFCDRRRGSTLFLRSVAKTSTVLVIYEFGCIKQNKYKHLFYLTLYEQTIFLANLWGAYAIPLALSVVRSANVYHVHGLCLLGIGGTPTSVIKLWLKYHIFTFSTSLKRPAGSRFFWQNFEYGKMQKFGFCLKDL